MKKIINLISGPRNLSTALMYSFAQREDSIVLDEPFYAYYLHNAPLEVTHPVNESILESMPTNENEVIDKIEELAENKIVFVKGMAHHFLSEKPEHILNWSNIILIRHPKKLIASFSKVIENPSITDIGIKKASEMFLFLKQNNRTPIVIDSDELLVNPSQYLQKLCELLDIPFSETMLSWEKDGIPEDGVWAPFWYKNVHNSEGFAVQKSSSRVFPERLTDLLEEAMPYYETLKNHILKNN